MPSILSKIKIPRLSSCDFFKILIKKSKKSELKTKLTELDNYARNSYCFEFSEEHLGTFMMLAGGDSQKARESIDDYHDTKYGYLVPVTSEKQDLILNGGGVENDENTSCYIDSLLYAMFSSFSGFELLLASKSEYKALQQSIFSFVNTLRKGGLVKVSAVRELRELLVGANWRGKDQQEDVHEFFTYLSETFNLPYLSFLINLHHGGIKNSNDACITKDRSVSLNVPETGNLELEKMLTDHFYSDFVTGVDREVAANSVQKVNALRISKFLPFYYSASDIEDFAFSQDVTSPIILPIVLKRYKSNQDGTIAKVKTKVKLSPQFSFDKYVDLDGRKCSQCYSKMEFTAILKSVICHKGETADSGHYIAYSKSTARDHWYRLDDSDSPNRVKRIDDVATVFDELSQDGYLFFYELYYTCKNHHGSVSLDDSKTPFGNSFIKYISGITTPKCVAV